MASSNQPKVSSKLPLERSVSLNGKDLRSTSSDSTNESLEDSSKHQTTEGHSDREAQADKSGSAKKSLNRSVFDSQYMQRPPSHLSIRQSWQESFKQNNLEDLSHQEQIVEESEIVEQTQTVDEGDISISQNDISDASTQPEDISQIGACIECFKAVPVFKQEEIDIGDHIIFPGALYDHHGIVVGKESNGTTIKIIEATNTVSGVAVGSFAGRKTKIAISAKMLDFSKQKISVVVYKKRRYSKWQVAKRAEAYKDETKEKYKYNLMDNNCEHFATFCVTGQRFSIQARKVRLTFRLFLSEGFRGISDERIRNQKEFDNNILCLDCYKMNEQLLSVDVTPITRADQVKAGDIIRYSYYNLWHDAVVLNMKRMEETYVVCNIAHYAFCGIFSHRTIKAEDLKITFDGKISKLAYEPPKYHVYPPTTVVERALRRLGEQEFVFFSNDSSHYARWCKLELEKVI